MQARTQTGSVPTLVRWGVRTVASQRVRCIGSRTLPGGGHGRVCIVCHTQVPEGLGVYQVHLSALTHQGSCNAVIAGLERVPGSTPRERKRPLHELMALANGARCVMCLAEETP
jgi:hypothetical protein